MLYKSVLISSDAGTSLNYPDDTMQCSIPAFYGIFPDADDNSRIQKLLHVICEWHALAKLRLHTDQTLALLEETTIAVGVEFRHFSRNICPEYATIETGREVSKRKHLEKRGKAGAAVTDGSEGNATE